MGPAEFSRPNLTGDTWEALVTWLRSAYQAGDSDAIDAVGGEGAAGALKFAQERAAALLGRSWDGSAWVEVPGSKYVVSDTIRDQVKGLVEDAIANGRTVGELNEAIADTFADIKGRSLMIANTETTIAYNAGSVAGYKVQGVTHVEVMDGGTPGSCAECDEANGQIWTIAEAAANPSAHPNCTRSFLPIIPDEEDQ
ncbi:MAG: phage minor head protein [Candidatus Nanopelagicales bacterium]|nr:phage minor head protein [Candidatus Nanopelagicales bacterium]